MIERDACRVMPRAGVLWVYSGPVLHRWDGEWRPQDAAIRPLAELSGLAEAAGDGRYALGCARYCGFVANDTTKVDGTTHGVAIQLPSGDWVEFKAIGGHDSVGVVVTDGRGARLEYGDCFGQADTGMDVSHWPVATGMRTTLSLYSATVRDFFLAQPPEFAVTIPEGSYMMETPEENFVVESETEERLWTFSRWMSARDASGAVCARCCEYDIQEPPDNLWRWHIFVVPSAEGRAWLIDPARVWPVEIDPDVTAGAQSGCLLSSSLVDWTTTRNGASVSAMVGGSIRVFAQYFFGGQWDIFRGMQQFDISALGTTAVRTYYHAKCKGVATDGGSIQHDLIPYYDTLTPADWAQTSEGVEGTKAVADLTADQWYSMPLSDAGFDGRTSYCLWLREGHDVEDVDPGGGPDKAHGVELYGIDTPGSEPYLEIVLAQGDGLGPFTGHMIRGDGGMLSR